MEARLDRGLWALVLAIVTAVALTASGVLWWTAWQAVYDAGAAWVVGWLLAVGLGTVALRAGGADRLLAAGLLPAIGVALALRMAVAWLIDVPLISDFKDYHDLALGTLQGGPWLQEGRPMGYPLVLAAAYGMFGPSQAVGEGVGVVLGVLGVFAVHALARPLVGDRAATAAAWAFTVWPAHLLLTPVLGTEVPYTTIFLLAMAALVRVGPATAGAAAWACLAGLLLAAAQYVRPTSLALVPAVWAFLVRGLETWRRRAAALLVFSATLLALLAPVAAFNHAHLGRWSLSTSAYGNWSLLVGMNQRHNGMWNVEDAAEADRLGDRRAVDAWAGEEGRRRLLAEPGATLALVGRKFPIMWALEDYGTYWAYGFRPDANPALRAMLSLAAQTFYAAVTVLAALALWRRRRWPPGVWPLWGGLLLLVGVHSLLEVQSRYHCYWTPVFIVLAASLVGSTEET